ncbi:MAG: PEP-CTERM sorting domain-containing protein [Planctomycetota bacterium]|jgi:hypothetical protein
MQRVGTLKVARATVAGLLVTLGLSLDAQADVVLDSGTPDESTNYSIFANSALGAAQFLAQEFSLADPVHLDTIELYLGTTSAGATVTIDLAGRIRSGATPADIITTFSLTAPLATPSAGDWVAASVHVNLAPGTYYIVYSAGTPGAYAPLRAPNDIGGRLYSASDSSFPFTNVNTSLPIASNFSLLGDPRGTGVRLSGGAIPEPSILLLVGLAFAVAGWLVGRRRRGKKTA